MPAYVIVEIEVFDQKRYDQYRQIAGPAIEQYGGRFIVRGGNPQVLEGDWSPKRLVVIEFSSAERAKEWFTSPEYAPAKALRKDAARVRIVLADGV